jgi:hypothetical protein
VKRSANKKSRSSRDLMHSKKAEPKRPRGRPEFRPTEDQRRQVELMVGYGIEQERICRVIINPSTKLPIAKHTLEKAFADEIRTASVKVDALVVEAHIVKCRGRPAEYDRNGNMIRRELQPDTTAIIWWEKARMGWKETTVIERKDHYDLSVFTEEELELFESLARKASP